MIHSSTGDIPGGYRKIYVDAPAVFHHGKEPPAASTLLGLIPANWFALEAMPGRVYGATVLLLLPEGGAPYRDLPIHTLAHTLDPEPDWTSEDAQSWDCYSYHFTSIAYRRAHPRRGARHETRTVVHAVGWRNLLAS